MRQVWCGSGIEGPTHHRGWPFVEIRGFDLCLDPLLTQAMNNTWQILSEHLSKLALDFALYEFLNDGYRVEGAVDVDILERVGFKYEGDAFLFGDDEHDIRVELEVGETEKHGYDERFSGCQHSSRTSHEVYIRLLMVQRIRLVHTVITGPEMHKDR
jgi:hypothetical protein